MLVVVEEKQEQSNCIELLEMKKQILLWDRNVGCLVLAGTFDNLSNSGDVTKWIESGLEVDQKQIASGLEVD